MKKVVVLGCGLVGSVMARDLAADPNIDVTVADISEKNLGEIRNWPRIRTKKADLSNPRDIAQTIRDADAVVGAVPGRIGFAMLETVIDNGKPIADISFSPEDPLQLDSLAKSKGVTAVVDCGVSPGISNLAIGRAAARMKEIDSAVIYVGGLPVERHWPFEYRSVFSPTDVIEEYTRPARLVENERVVTKPALSEVELIDFPGVGTLEAFNTDGLRTLLSTVRAKNMKEKTLRYPGHADRMRMLRETGFFSDEARAMTEKLLFEKWRKPPEEEELTVLRVVVEGNQKRMTFDLLDRTDVATGTTSMARTTGFPCVIMARMLANGEYNEAGVKPPEAFGGNESVYQHLVMELAKRGVHLRTSE